MRTGVCDVGTYTVDVALDDDGEYIDSESGSVESGVFTAQERIAESLERDYRQKMPYKIVEDVLRTGRFRASGDLVDYSAEVEEALAPLRSATLQPAQRKWKAGTTVDGLSIRAAERTGTARRNERLSTDAVSQTGTDRQRAGLLELCPVRGDGTMSGFYQLDQRFDGGKTGKRGGMSSKRPPKREHKLIAFKAFFDTDRDILEWWEGCRTASAGS
ncbi:hypothetical protein [Candidatus Flexifilum breve]|uniref:hypothetical protein n=1 Tax=Candidatus Flexifilum breve TaxID=3140694 RepID=UPI0031CC5B68